MLRSINPELTPGDIRQILVGTARDVQVDTNARDDGCGNPPRAIWKDLDAAAAVEHVLALESTSHVRAQRLGSAEEQLRDQAPQPSSTTAAPSPTPAGGTEAIPAPCQKWRYQQACAAVLHTVEEYWEQARTSFVVDLREFPEAFTRELEDNQDELREYYTEEYTESAQSYLSGAIDAWSFTWSSTSGVRWDAWVEELLSGAEIAGVRTVHLKYSAETQEMTVTPTDQDQWRPDVAILNYSITLHIEIAWEVKKDPSPEHPLSGDRYELYGGRFKELESNPQKFCLEASGRTEWRLVNSRWLLHNDELASQRQCA